MGRAAAVREKTKGKTDLRKAKCNATFGKKIIMAVKQGGSPSTDANRALADVIKQAKANNVPADVSVLLETDMYIIVDHIIVLTCIYRDT
jgi:transcriptional/translational regulatory protein YebC/TACO1